MHERLMIRADALELKRKIETAQKDARDGVDASIKTEEEIWETEQSTTLQSAINTGTIVFAPLRRVADEQPAFVTVRSVRLALEIVQKAQNKGLEVDRVSHQFWVCLSELNIQAPRSKNIVGTTSIGSRAMTEISDMEQLRSRPG